ncbi:lipocalin family protein [Brevundimonas viscosa]|uniref:Outer membrane lipoprotein Blc n=1 Tax=Brevundimonas viscosa TaxID=871741 RepID=A0A1I6NUS6_9CAUL|nr:lipocalin family protein [Brevundimonas viscosa]SFS31766.1 apolipoprotein D and lipocalin family protein [Brevundimonas viscosa]
MSPSRLMPALLLAGAALAVAGCATLQRGPVGNAAVPQPARPVDLNRYAGLWYEIARYENGFERGCEGVTAEYTLRDDGLVGVRNACRQGSPGGELKVANGRARVIEGGDGAKLKVSFFGPFFLGDYWVLDRADDYSWSIVGEPSGRYLWLLSRSPTPAPTVRETIMNRARALGYDLALLRTVEQPPAGHVPPASQ